MIQDTDEDILNSDFLKWTVSIKQSFKCQIIDGIHKREFAYTRNLKGYEIQNIYPFTTNIYVQYRSNLSKLFIPLSIPIEVSVISADSEDVKYCVNSAFDILLDKMRSGFDVIGNPENTHDYRYFFPMTSPLSAVTDKDNSSMTLTYTIKNMKSNLFKDTYEILQRVSLL